MTKKTKVGMVAFLRAPGGVFLGLRILRQMEGELSIGSKTTAVLERGVSYFLFLKTVMESVKEKWRRECMAFR